MSTLSIDWIPSLVLIVHWWMLVFGSAAVSQHPTLMLLFGPLACWICHQSKSWHPFACFVDRRGHIEFCIELIEIAHRHCLGIKVQAVHARLELAERDTSSPARGNYCWCSGFGASRNLGTKGIDSSLWYGESAWQRDLFCCACFVQISVLSPLFQVSRSVVRALISTFSAHWLGPFVNLSLMGSAWRSVKSDHQQDGIWTSFFVSHCS